MQMKPARCFLRDNFAKRPRYNVSWKRTKVSNQRPTIKMQDKVTFTRFPTFISSTSTTELMPL